MLLSKAMTNLQLSENLYPLDEVFMTFVQCLIKRESQHETLYWLFEIVASANEILDGLACIYLQFYSIGNKGLEKYLQTKARKYRSDSNVRHLCNMVNNMRLANPTIDSYEIARNSVTQVSPNKIYKSEEWIKCHPPYSYGLIKSIHANDRHNIGAYLHVMLEKYGFDETYSVIMNYLITVRNIQYENMKLTKENWPNDIFLLSAIISNANINYAIDDRSMKFVAVPQTVVDNMFNHFTKKSDKYWLKLAERRLYPTHSKLGCGSYNRYEIEESLQNASHNSWEYYCYDSTEWNKRFKKYKALKNDEKKIVEFPDDDYLEAFYDDDNAMDFDEQSKKVQQMSLHEITVYSDINSWFNDLLRERLIQNMSNISLS